ncbi:hypothetical protein ACFYTQ_09690 [Nocardia sp. NPDC004068]|uniref:hypothetical protein n=1 Tax=Nocardia sp. NPDC004068 TaxID=3364303 RepID=UPI003694FD90
MIRAAGSLALVAAAAVAITGCAHGFGSRTEKSDMTQHVPVDTTLTEERARQRIVEILTDTLRRLPAAIALTWQHPHFPDTVFGDATVVPCVDDDSAPDPPYNAAADYWISGMPGDGAAHYRDLFERAWRDLGWRPLRDERDPGMPQLRAGTPDVYLLTLTQNSRGDLALSVSSPCFPNHARGGTPMPSVITHP